MNSKTSQLLSYLLVASCFLQTINSQIYQTQYSTSSSSVQQSQSSSSGSYPQVPQNYPASQQNLQRPVPSNNLSNRNDNGQQPVRPVTNQQNDQALNQNRPQQPNRQEYNPTPNIQDPILFTNNAVNKASDDLKMQALSEVTEGAERFALNLYLKIAEQHPGNFMISPFSVWSLLTVMAEGSKANTLAQIQNSLGIPADVNKIRLAYQVIYESLTVNTPGVQLSTFQAIVADKNRPVKSEFQSKIESDYKAEVLSVDFTNPKAAFTYVNEYVANHTRGEIQKILTPEDVLKAQLIMLSGIFFQGEWRSPFNSTFTQTESFFNHNQVETGKVQMMFQRGAFPYAANLELGAHMLELPYGHENKLSMILLLPKKGAHLKSVIINLQKVKVQTIFDELEKAAREYEDDEVEVHIPKFITVSDFNLNSILSSLGISDIFNEQSANLQGIAAGLYLSGMIHKSKIQVDEKGTVASAVTGGIFANKATPPRFYANRPFAYLIVDKTTKLVLFTGLYQDPNQFT